MHVTKLKLKCISFTFISFGARNQTRLGQRVGQRRAGLAGAGVDVRAAQGAGARLPGRVLCRRRRHADDERYRLQDTVQLTLSHW